VRVTKERQEAHERAEHRRQQDKDTFEKVAAERAAELDAIRKRTEELRNLRLAQEPRGSVRRKVSSARVAKSVTKETLAEWLEDQQKSGRKT
jgi:hypothetical protein